MLIINAQLSIPLREFEFQFSRSPGPGGQNVNKLNTKVILRWNVNNSPSLSDALKGRICSTYHRRINKEGEFLVSSHRFRDQGRNVADSLNKLKELLLVVASPPKTRKATAPSKASKRRRLENKRKNADKKKSRREPRDD